MFTGTVTKRLKRGGWLIRQDLTFFVVHVHQQFVVGGKFLHVGDRVRFTVSSIQRPKIGVVADRVEIL